MVPTLYDVIYKTSSTHASHEAASQGAPRALERRENFAGRALDPVGRERPRDELLEDARLKLTYCTGP